MFQIRSKVSDSSRLKSVKNLTLNGSRNVLIEMVRIDIQK